MIYVKERFDLCFSYKIVLNFVYIYVWLKVNIKMARFNTFVGLLYFYASFTLLNVYNFVLRPLYILKYIYYSWAFMNHQISKQDLDLMKMGNQIKN